LRFAVEEILSRGFEFLVVARHQCDVVDGAIAQVVTHPVLDQGAHDLLGGFCGGDVGEDVAAVRFFGVADPPGAARGQHGDDVLDAVAFGGSESADEFSLALEEGEVVG
jgi:hypothetical protein